MNSDLFILSSDSIVTGMSEKGYATESELQEIVEKNPGLLVRPTDGGDYQIYLVKREQSLRADDAGTTYSLDHLCVGSDGIPVLVEVKRSSDSRIHREVVGQLIDYAAHITDVDIKKMGQEFGEANKDAALPTIDDGFWDTVSRNIQANRMKLVFVADSIPSSLKLMIEFLDRSFQTIDVYGVELKKHHSEGKEILCRSFVESTVKAERREYEKSFKQWTEETFRERVVQSAGVDTANAVSQLVEFAAKAGYDVRYGKGGSHASVMLRPPKVGKSAFSIYAANTSNVLVYIENKCVTETTGGQVGPEKMLNLLRSGGCSEDEAHLSDGEKYVLVQAKALQNEKKIAAMKTILEDVISSQQSSC